MAMAVLVSAIVPALVPSLVAADQVTARSIQLSSASTTAQNVTYTVNFTPVANAGAFILDFCTNTPLYGEDCLAPTGFTLASATATTTGFTDESALDANTMRITGDMTAATPVSVDVTGVTNPTNAGNVYARIITFDTATNADAYVSNPVEPAVNTGMVDNGGVALYFNPSIGVSGAVLESMTFCVSKAVPTKDCTGVTAPTLALGKDVGAGVIALSPSEVSTGDLYTQISTNAASGAVVRLKSNALSCGGLLRAGAPSACDILPALTGGDITAGQAKFGVKAAAAADPVDAATPSGTFRVANGASYNASTFELKYASNNLTGVTSVYGDPILDTNDLPINNRNMQLTFGASISNTTPAGRYSADLSLVATGKF